MSLAFKGLDVIWNQYAKFEVPQGESEISVRTSIFGENYVRLYAMMNRIHW